MNTPWGKSDSQNKIADGIVFYSTPSHGGFKLDADKLKFINPKAFTCGKYAGFRDNRKAGWFEEDCDAHFVVMAFPEYFTDEQYQSAQQSIKYFYPEALEGVAI